MVLVDAVVRTMGIVIGERVVGQAQQDYVQKSLRDGRDDLL